MLAGCSRTTSPTSPTSVPASIGASSTASPIAVSHAAQNQVPFKGTFQGSDTVAPPTITTRATGTGTHLGQFSFAHVITFPALTGSSHWVAANGDSIDTTIAGSGEPTDTPGIIRITDIQTISGGTGRFAGAQGSFTVERLASVVTFLTSGSFHGTITSPGAAH